MLKKLLIILVSIIFISSPSAQDHNIPGEALIQLKKGVSPVYFSQSSRTSNFPLAMELIRPVSAKRNIYLFAYHPADSKEAVALIRQHPQVELAQANGFATRRDLKPNDPEFFDQWHLDKIRAPEFWETATGGTTSTGDTIVVAILDDGYEIDHEDLDGNLWINRDEVPGDGIDNDSNGFIGDVVGWNFDSGNGQHFIDPHGTEVAGIIGAEGDNGLAGSGVNWNVKLLYLTNRSGLIVNIVEALYYIADTRREYNESNGQKGAFIVANNNSFGVDRAFCGEYPLWKAVYDTLGAYGVLSIASTANDDIDVDEKGDIPSTCPSPHLINVTNTDFMDQKYINAAYSTESVDIGAPGVDIYTTQLNDGFGNARNGTSYSAPQVAGAVALLYSLPCPKIADLFRLSPSAAALLIRDFILDGVDQNADLVELLKSGGRLNLENSLELAREFCGGEKGPLAISNLFPNPAPSGMSEINMEFVTPEFTPYQIKLYNALGQLLEEREVIPNEFSLNRETFDISILAPGVYFVTIENNNGIEASSFVKR